MLIKKNLRIKLTGENKAYRFTPIYVYEHERECYIPWLLVSGHKSSNTISWKIKTRNWQDQTTTNDHLNKRLRSINSSFPGFKRSYWGRYHRGLLQRSYDTEIRISASHENLSEAKDHQQWVSVFTTNFHDSNLNLRDIQKNMSGNLSPDSLLNTRILSMGRHEYFMICTNANLSNISWGTILTEIEFASMITHDFSAWRLPTKPTTTPDKLLERLSDFTFDHCWSGER